jgi:hypothetical protein
MPDSTTYAASGGGVGRERWELCGVAFNVPLQAIVIAGLRFADRATSLRVGQASQS